MTAEVCFSLVLSPKMLLLPVKHDTLWQSVAFHAIPHLNLYLAGQSMAQHNTAWHSMGRHRA